MKREVLAVLVCFCMFFGILSGCSNDDVQVTDPTTTQATAPATQELLSGLEVTVHKVVDTSNVIVYFNLDRGGYTDVSNYEVKNAAGEPQEIEAVPSAFAELGGEVPNVFKIVFVSPLNPGDYTITVSNIVDGQSETYAPVSTILTIAEDTDGTGAGGQAEQLTELKLSVYKVLDNSNVVIRFNKSTILGATDVPNYEVKNEAGEVLKIEAVPSAFAELGGEVTDVFKIIFTSPLEPGNYTITVSNITDSQSTSVNTYAPATATLIIS